MEQVIQLEKVNKWFDDFHVLKDIDLTVTKGQKIGSMAEKANDGKNQTILHFELRRGTQSVNPENYFE